MFLDSQGVPTAPAQASPDPAMSSGDHPVLADEGAPAEVETRASLEREGRGGETCSLIPDPSLSNPPLLSFPLPAGTPAKARSWGQRPLH